MQYRVETVIKIVKATCVLHNFLRDRNLDVQIYTQDSILKGLNTCLRMEQWSIYISQDIGLQRRLREYVVFLLPISMVWQVDLLGRTSTYKEELNIPRVLDTADSCTLPPPDCPAVAARGYSHLMSHVLSHLLSHLWCHLLSHWLAHLLI